MTISILLKNLVRPLDPFGSRGRGEALEPEVGTIQ